MKPTNTPCATVIVLAWLSMLLCFQSCREDLEGTLPVIKQEMIGDYLTNRPEHFSEFTGMLNKSGVMGLLKAYGHYTVFAPTNEAIEQYYAYLSEEMEEPITSYEQLTMSELREFCYNHIINADSLSTKYLQPGLISSRTMSGRFYSVTYTDSGIIINDNARILARDIMVHNGIIHVMDKAFRPAYGAIAEVFEKDSTRFSIYVKALKATGVYDKMNKSRIMDETYNYKFGPQPTFDKDGNFFDQKLESLHFGFTILAVSDADLATYVDVAAGLPNGIHSLADLEKLARYHYSIAFNHDADDITDKKDPIHYLNRFISYHCFDRILYSSRFVKDYFTPNHFPRYPMPEYIETMLENTIVEVLLDKQGSTIGPALAADSSSAYGVFNFDDPAQRALLTDLKDLPPGGSINGYYHGINRPIMYTRTFSTALSSKRLRMDVASFFPELTTNNLRGRNPTGERIFVNRNRIPRWVIDNKQVKNIDLSYSTRLLYWEPSFENCFYQGDNFTFLGKIHFTLKTCPIPAGTYEVRLGIQAGTEYPLQFYVDDRPCSTPVNIGGIRYFLYNLRRSENFDEYEFDRIMRNNNCLTAPNTLFFYGDHLITDTVTARDNSLNAIVTIRYILGTYTFEKTEKHSLTTILLGEDDGAFNLDYIEFCPVSYLQKEGFD